MTIDPGQVEIFRALAIAAQMIHAGRADQIKQETVRTIHGWADERLFPPGDAREQRNLRRTVMRRLRFEHYRDMSQSAAAQMIATAWAASRPSDEEHVPGSKEELFERLHREGIQPCSSRTIISDLDR